MSLTFNKYFTFFRIQGQWFEPQLSYLFSKNYYWMQTQNEIHTPKSSELFGTQGT